MPLTVFGGKEALDSNLDAMSTGVDPIDYLAKAMAKDPMGGLGPVAMPMGGVIVNPKNFYAKVLDAAAPNLYNKLKNSATRYTFQETPNLGSYLEAISPGEHALPEGYVVAGLHDVPPDKYRSLFSWPPFKAQTQASIHIDPNVQTEGVEGLIRNIAHEALHGVYFDKTGITIPSRNVTYNWLERAPWSESDKFRDVYKTKDPRDVAHGLLDYMANNIAKRAMRPK